MPTSWERDSHSRIESFQGTQYMKSEKNHSKTYHNYNINYTEQWKNIYKGKSIRIITYFLTEMLKIRSE
jgi:hypothetical protein